MNKKPSFLQRLFSPQILFPIILVALLNAALLFFGNLSEIWRLVIQFRKEYIFYTIIIIAAYEIIRGMQWRYIIDELHLDMNTHSQWYAFFIGEMSKNIPLGNYVQSYVLHHLEGKGFLSLSGVATYIILLELVVTLTGLLLLGVGNWSVWIRPVIIIGVLVILVGTYGVRRFQVHMPIPSYMQHTRFIQTMKKEYTNFKSLSRQLFQPKICVVSLIYSAVYLLLASAGLYTIILGLGYTSLTIWNAISIYFFSLAFVLVAPVALDLGAMEVGSVGAFLVFGAGRNIAVGAALLDRLFTFGDAFIIAVIASILLRDQAMMLARRVVHS